MNQVLTLPNKIKNNIVGEFIYRHSLMAFLAASRILQRVRYPVPNHWESLVETLQVSSDVFYSKIALSESDVEEEFREKQERIEALKDRSLYSNEDVKKICAEREARGL